RRRPAPKRFERFDEKQDFSGHPVVQLGRLGQTAFTVPGDDGLKSVNEGASIAWQILVRRETAHKVLRTALVPAQQELRHSECDPPFRTAVFATAATICKKVGGGIALCIRGSGMVAGVAFDISKIRPRQPGL